MMHIRAVSRFVCGAFAIIAISFVSGCATPTMNQPMSYHDLEYFQIDCSRKEEQIRFLQSLRTNRDDRLWAWAENYVMSWDQYLRPGTYDERRSIASGRTNWLINQNLMMISRNC